jgi:hypothetical protein
LSGTLKRRDIFDVLTWRQREDAPGAQVPPDRSSARPAQACVSD